MKTAADFCYNELIMGTTDKDHETRIKQIKQRDLEIRETTIKECLELVSRVSELPIQERILSLLQTNKEKEEK